MDEFHLTVLALSNLPKRAYEAIVHTLDKPRFHAEVRRAIRKVFGRYPALHSVTVRLTR
jgi:hypothetical protein